MTAKQPKFRTMFDPSEKHFSEPGSQYHDTYVLKTTKSGEKRLTKTGTIDQYSYIQSFRDSTDLHKIIEKYNLIKDPALLNVHEPMYGDFLGMPTNLIEVKKAAENAEIFFNELPIEIRRAYGFSAGAFFADAGSDHFNGIITKHYKLDGDKVDEAITGSELDTTIEKEAEVTE